MLVTPIKIELLDNNMIILYFLNIPKPTNKINEHKAIPPQNPRCLNNSEYEAIWTEPWYFATTVVICNLPSHITCTFLEYVCVFCKCARGLRGCEWVQLFAPITLGKFAMS